MYVDIDNMYAGGVVSQPSKHVVLDMLSFKACHAIQTLLTGARQQPAPGAAAAGPDVRPVLGSKVGRRAEGERYY